MKKMNKKGFTLIELLAIIVILAIIAVITVPIILNIIENAREGAAKNSVIGYGKSVELAYTQYQYDVNLGTAPTVTNNDSEGKSILVYTATPTSSASTLRMAVEFDGDKVVCSGTNYLDNGKVVLAGCHVNGDTNKTYTYHDGKADLVQ
jgi:prepilin-type N-terminal cleavage/methylation domain-containing protein